MFKKYVLIQVGFLLILSCSYFENQSNREPIQQVDTIINFNAVDAFPLFPNCQYIPSREKQQICFQVEMAQHIYGFLKEYELNVKDSINDTAWVKLKIDALGKTSVSGMQISDKTKEVLPQLDSIIRLSIQKLPNLKPAIKRDMPVTTEFTLPVVLKN